MEPSAVATRSAATFGATPAWVVRNPLTTSSLNRPSRTTTDRERIVGRSWRGSAAVITKFVSAGGSSSTLSSAFEDSSEPACAISRSASPRMITFFFASAGVSMTRLTMSRALATPCAHMPSGLPQSGFWRRSSMISASVSAASSTCLSGSPALGRGMGTNQWTSGWPEIEHPFAGAALAAGLPCRPFTEQPLGDPERQSLLADPIGTCQKERLGQGSPGDRLAWIRDRASSCPIRGSSGMEGTYSEGGKAGRVFSCNTFIHNDLARVLVATNLRQNGTWSEPHHVASTHSQNAM